MLERKIALYVSTINESNPFTGLDALPTIGLAPGEGCVQTRRLHR